ncbi:hypothetical protein ABI_25340 [Asticcacaulis biprosthecium C19]|uniref:Uncharacterized protein n=1 Tax=Asticcacaulis biprosthecium C19 TaxID=715226 RepID=F4QP62_9CAUL|nr:hypothetical protein [Asticcacaulis biprosthecium]EGF91120.1 hypothetical protein ABI_25340 [Asticcacaulis biprosthecium C19]
MEKSVNPEAIADDIRAWNDRAERLIAEVAGRDTPVTTTHKAVRLTAEKRGLADLFRKKTAPFEVSAATINSALDKVRKGRRTRSDIPDFPESFAGGSRMDILRPRRDRYEG